MHGRAGSLGRGGAGSREERAPGGAAERRPRPGRGEEGAARGARTEEGRAGGSPPRFRLPASPEARSVPGPAVPRWGSVGAGRRGVVPVSPAPPTRRPHLPNAMRLNSR